MTTSRYTGLVVPGSGKQLTHIVRVRRSPFFILNISTDFINSIYWVKDISIDF
jgi:hypothetical protein